MPDETLFRRTVKTVGCAIIGQTGDLAPADKRLYAIRDVTATVDSIPLITASILSKKLAAGLQTLVLDVKVGNGAFMQSVEDARNLARALADVANGAGLPTTALITDMNQPLGDAAGNAVEIVNCLEFLAGRKARTRLQRLFLPSRRKCWCRLARPPLWMTVRRWLRPLFPPVGPWKSLRKW